MHTQEYEKWKGSIEAFKEKTEDFYAGKIDKKEYKGFSGKYGSYAQRDQKSSMLRLRLGGGVISKEKLKFIADVIEKHQINLVHLTTCQTVQLHHLHPFAVYDIMENALDYGIVTMGGGGDYPRNITMSPLSGLEEECFDVLPYVRAAEEYLMGMIEMKKMPRKLKVSFSNGSDSIAHTTFRDLGFVARRDGTFDVYSAGGLGANPRFGLKVAEGVEPEKILYHIRAMWEVFTTYGNYENRAKARTRYMQQALGEEGYKKAYREKLEEVMNSGNGLDITPEKIEQAKRGDGSQAEGKWIVKQKQEGLYAVHYHPMGGLIKPSKFREIYDAIKDMDQAEIRLSPDESMYIVNLTGKEAERVLAVTNDGAETDFETSVACIGASICQVGVRDSQKLLKAVTEAVREAGIPDGALPKINISGCPSSCGTHQVGVLGFRGGVKIMDKVPVPAFNLFFNGCDREGKERMGREMGTMLEKDIPPFLAELGKTVSASGTDFYQWILGKESEFEQIAGRYLAK